MVGKLWADGNFKSWLGVVDLQLQEFKKSLNNKNSINSVNNIYWL